MRFTKMHGIGNDYVYVDLIAEPSVSLDWPAVARKVADRHKGVGGDGLILVAPAETGVDADGRMVMFNADGSQAEMCGNGLRCVAKLIYDRGHCRKDALAIQTGSGVLTVDVVDGDGTAAGNFRVNMGPPRLAAGDVPTTLSLDEANRGTLDVDGRSFEVACVSMGNPHCVVFVDEPTDDLVFGVGPKIETHAAFPNRTNVEFVRVDSPDQFTQRTWERGSGETQACGTGASAVLVAGVLSGRLANRATGTLLGGDLMLEWDGGDAPVHKTGPATTVFTGEIEV